MILGCVTALGAAVVQWYKEKKNGDKHHNYTLFFVFIGTVLATITSIMQSIESEKSERKLINSYKELKQESDSNSIHIINSLAEYGLKYDVAQKRIEKLVKDSMRIVKTTIIQPELPTITMGDDGHEEIELTPDKKWFRYSFVSNNATSTKINIKISSVFSNSLDSFLYGGMIKVNKKVIAKNQGFLGKIPRDTSNCKLFIVWCRGSYWNIDKTKSFEIDETFIRNNETNVLRILTGDTRQFVINLINKAEKQK